MRCRRPRPHLLKNWLNGLSVPLVLAAGWIVFLSQSNDVYPLRRTGQKRNISGFWKLYFRNSSNLTRNFLCPPCHLAHTELRQISTPLQSHQQRRTIRRGKLKLQRRFHPYLQSLGHCALGLYIYVNRCTYSKGKRKSCNPLAEWRLLCWRCFSVLEGKKNVRIK